MQVPWLFPLPKGKNKQQLRIISWNHWKSVKRIISVGRGASDTSSLLYSSLVRSWSMLWTRGSGLSQLTCQAPDGSPGAAIVQDHLHLLPQNPDSENRSMAGEGCSIRFWRRSHPRCCCSSFHCGYTPLRAGGLIKQQHGTDESTNTSVVLQTEDRNEQRLWVLWGVFVPVPSTVERHEFLLRSDVLLCLWKKEKRGKEWRAFHCSCWVGWFLSLTVVR